MKNIDIEKLARQNSYKTPDHFFDEMQRNVLQKVAPQKQTKIFAMNWVYYAAAAIALLFGLVFFINNSTKVSNQQSIAQTPTEKINTSPAITTNNNIEPVEKIAENIPNESSQEKIIIDQEYRAPKSTSTNIEKTIAANTKPAIFAKKEEKEVSVEQVLASFNSDEIIAISKNTEQDVYLDLYN